MINRELETNAKFLQQKADYFRRFVLTHRDAYRQLRSAGQLEKKWRRASTHQVLSAVAVEVIGDLIGLTEEDVVKVVSFALTHDIDKRELYEKYAKDSDMKAMVLDEFSKTEPMERATGNNWVDFEQWNLIECIIRYVDSSAGEVKETDSTTGQTKYKAEFLPWRDRVNGLRDRKLEDEIGKEKYGGIGMWDKLWEVTEKVERELYAQIMTLNPTLAASYPSSIDLTRLVEDKMIEKIRGEYGK